MYKRQELIAGDVLAKLGAVEQLGMESRMIEKTIRECEGNLSVVAARLDVPADTHWPHAVP